MATYYDYASKGLVSCELKDKNTGVIFVLPPPAGGNFDPEIELGTFEESNCRGITVNAKRFTTKQGGKLTVNFGAPMPEVIGIKLGRRIAKAASAVNDLDVSHFEVPSDGIVAAAVAGFVGNGIAANAASSAYFLNEDGFSEALVQDPDFATFDPTAGGNEKKFAVGANGALKFGSDVWGRRVTMEMPFSTADFYSLGDDLISLSMRVVGVDLRLKQIVWIFPDISIEPAAIDLKEPAQEISFFVNRDFDVRWRQLQNICRDRVA